MSSPVVSSNGAANKNVCHDSFCVEVTVPESYGMAEEDLEGRCNNGGASFTRTCFNGLNALSGVGILSIPYALSKGGWLSLGLFVAMAAICCYTGLLLQRCMNSNPKIRTFPDIGKHAFGSKGQWIISFFLYLELYLIAIEFLILEGDNIDKLFPNKRFHIGKVGIQGKKMFMILAAIVILPTTWLKNLRALAVISVGGVIASFLLVASVTWVGLFNGVGFHQRGSLFNLRGLPTSVSLYTFCYCGHAVFPTIYTSMDNKRQFSKVLYTCFILCTLNYGSMAVIGYLMYGDSIQSQITLNMPKGKIASYVAIIMTLMNPLTKYALVATPIAKAVEEHLLISNNAFGRIVTRTLIVISTTLVALFIPFFGYVMALIGSSASVVVSVLIPCFCYVKLSEEFWKSTRDKVLIVVIVMVGMFVMIAGTITSLRQIIQSL